MARTMGSLRQNGLEINRYRATSKQNTNDFKRTYFQFEQNRLAYACYVHNDKDEEYFRIKI